MNVQAARSSVFLGLRPRTDMGRARGGKDERSLRCLRRTLRRNGLSSRVRGYRKRAKAAAKAKAQAQAQAAAGAQPAWVVDLLASFNRLEASIHQLQASFNRLHSSLNQLTESFNRMHASVVQLQDAVGQLQPQPATTNL